MEQQWDGSIYYKWRDWMLVRGIVVAILGALVIGGSVVALVEFDHRAGPLDPALEPVVLQVPVTGTYLARAAQLLGVCLEPPCGAQTTIEVRFEGLPPLDYSARLEGATAQSLGSLQRDGDAHVLRWGRSADHTDKERIVVFLADRAIATVPVTAQATPQRLDSVLTVGWGAAPATMRANEIGGFVISTVATATLDDAPPHGWVYRAWFESSAGRTDLGLLEPQDGRWVLDARVERVALEEQHGLVIEMIPPGGHVGFPVLEARL